MFREILTEPQQRLLELLTRIGEVRSVYLAGGTALALHLGHRRFRDLDFFRAAAFLPQDLLSRLLAAGEPAVLQEASGTLSVMLGGGQGLLPGRGDAPLPRPSVAVPQ